MKTKWLITMALALALPAGLLVAQDQNDPGSNPPPPQNDGPPGGGPGPHGRHHHPPLPLLQALDTNHDGILSADEIANASANLLKLDKNGDGQLTRDEYLPPRPPRRGDNTNAPADAPPPPDNQNDSGQPRHHRPIPPIVTALDTNGDGMISADEIANAPANLMKLDKNGDGQLTIDELMGPPPPRDGGPGGPEDEQRPAGPPPDQNN